MRAAYNSFPHYRQQDGMDCGPTCLKIISKFYGRNINIDKLRSLAEISKSGVSLLGISNAAKTVGLNVKAGIVAFKKLCDIQQSPCIIHWEKNHFVVLYKIKKDHIFISDPASGLIKYPKEAFLKKWCINSETESGVALFLQPSDLFFDTVDEKVDNKNAGLNYLFKTVNKHRPLVIQLLLVLLGSIIIQLTLPFLTKGLIDVGVNDVDLRYIHLILFGQLLMTIGYTFSESIRGWIILHITSRVNVDILSDFLNKLFRVPISFFDTKLTGDIIQRIDDHKRIENLINGNSINILFSTITLSVFSVILYYYSPMILFVFLFGSIVYYLWIDFFLKKRKKLDFKRFSILSQNHSMILQIIHGMHEIKVNNSNDLKLWEWETIQAKLFKYNVQYMGLSQYQTVGGTFLNQTKNVLILFIAAKLVIEKTITIGDMLAIQFIIGQMNTPISQLAPVLQSLQDAKLSVERLSDIQTVQDEEPLNNNNIINIPAQADLVLQGVSFNYPGAGSIPVLKNINTTIRKNKVTAIVGASGSGKTTLLKILSKAYPVTNGKIYLENIPFESVSPRVWRDNIGLVMQDGFIFSDTIYNNIALGLKKDNEKIIKSLRTANIHDFVASLPLGLDTKIGSDGKSLSGGQKQRILLSRVVFKDPGFIFLDEATSALDANNEKKIIENLDVFLKDKTVIIVAHRLSTVRNADNIIVLDNGEIVEEGKHSNLIEKKGHYYELIKNQLELGN